MLEDTVRHILVKNIALLIRFVKHFSHYFVGIMRVARLFRILCSSNSGFSVLLLTPYQLGNLSDQNFSATLAVARFFFLLSVIYNKLSVCLSLCGIAFVLFITLFGKAATAPKG